MLYEAFLDEEMKTAQDFKDKKEKEKDDKYDSYDNQSARNREKYKSGNYKDYENARHYVAKSREDLNNSTSLKGQDRFSKAADAVERHDRRHPDRKIVESFDVSVFE